MYDHNIGNNLGFQGIFARAPSYLNSRLLGYVTTGYIEPSSHSLGNWSPRVIFTCNINTEACNGLQRPRRSVKPPWKAHRLAFAAPEDQVRGRYLEGQGELVIIMDKKMEAAVLYRA